MSLDVYLRIPGHKAQRSTRSGIFVRENGQTVEISEFEWAKRCTDFMPSSVQPEAGTDEVFTANITHNLGKMAEEAGIYECLWRPDELGITKAKQLIKPLSAGLRKLKRDPERFIPLNPPNGCASIGNTSTPERGWWCARRRRPSSASPTPKTQGCWIFRGSPATCPR